ncbi:MAG: glycoside hydrolase family 3 protein [Faecousia sp.]
MIDLRNAPFFLNEEQIAWVESTLADLTTEEKAGQLFCVMGGDYTPETLKEMVGSGKVGGILFRPVVTGAQIRAEYAPLDQAAKVPLLKAANLEEGGCGGMSDGTLFGWPMLTAATDDPAMAEKFGRVCGTEGAQVGINWTFSPVCDLDLNYLNPITNVRTFGSDKERVKAMTERYVKAVQDCGVAACAKHFPGDGVDYRDQHLHPSVNSLHADQWYDSYGKVYENLIAGGLMSVMVGHIAQPYVAMDVNPELTFEEAMLPATLSRTLLTGVLREKYGFNGVITSDATIMGGYTMAMERRKAIPASIMAGCDMLVFNTDFEEDYRYILDALDNGSLTMERLEEAVTRILALKAKVCRKAENAPVPAAQWHAEAADKAITLVKNTQPEKLPMTPDRYPNIRLVTLGKDEILDGSVREITREILEENGFRVEVYEPFADDLHGSKNLPSHRLTLYMANYEQASNQTVVRIQWCPKHALDMPRFVNEEVSVFVSLANPYGLQDVPRVRTYINAYTATRTTIRLTIDKLMGKSPFQGTSPVDAFCGLPDTGL